MISKHQFVKAVVENSIVVLVILTTLAGFMLIIGFVYKIQTLVNTGKLLVVSMSLGTFTSLATGYAFKVSEVLEEELNEGRPYKVGEVVLDITVKPVSDHDKEWWEIRFEERRKDIKLISTYESDLFELDIPHGDLDQCSFERVEIKSIGRPSIVIIENRSNTEKITETYKIMKISFAPAFRKNDKIEQITIKRRIPSTAHAWPKIDKDSRKYLVTKDNKLVGNIGYTIRVPTSKIILRLKLFQDFEVRQVKLLDWHGNSIACLNPETINSNSPDSEYEYAEYRYIISPLPFQKRFYINTRLSIEILRDLSKSPIPQENVIQIDDSQIENKHLYIYI